MNKYTCVLELEIPKNIICKELIYHCYCMRDQVHGQLHISQGDVMQFIDCKEDELNDGVSSEKAHALLAWMQKNEIDYILCDQ